MQALRHCSHLRASGRLGPESPTGCTPADGIPLRGTDAHQASASLFPRQPRENERTCVISKDNWTEATVLGPGGRGHRLLRGGWVSRGASLPERLERHRPKMQSAARRPLGDGRKARSAPTPHPRLHLAARTCQPTCFAVSQGPHQPQGRVLQVDRSAESKALWEDTHWLGLGPRGPRVWLGCLGRGLPARSSWPLICPVLAQCPLCPGSPAQVVDGGFRIFGHLSASGGVGEPWAGWPGEVRGVRTLGLLALGPAPGQSSTLWPLEVTCPPKDKSSSSPSSRGGWGTSWSAC